MHKRTGEKNEGMNERKEGRQTEGKKKFACSNQSNK